MPKFITIMRVKLDAKRRVFAGEVLELSAKAAEPLLAAGAIAPHKEAKAEKAPAPAPAPAPTPPEPPEPDESDEPVPAPAPAGEPT